MTLVVPTGAQAQQRALTAVEQARWRALLEQAFAQSNQGQHAVALQLAQEAATTQVTPGVRLFLAEEHEFLSREEGGAPHLSEAERLAAECFEDATSQRSLDGRDRILRDCGAVRDRVRARMVRLTVNVPTPPPGVTVTVNGEALPSSSFGVEARRLPGSYVIEATAPQHGSFRHTATLGEGTAATVTVAVPAPGRVQETRERAVTPPTLPDLPPPVVMPPPEPPDLTTPALRIVGGALVGLGAVAGGVGIWQAVVTSSNASLAAGASRTSSDPSAQAWIFYNNTVNTNRALTSDQVCQRASQDAASNADAAQVRSLCEANSTSQALAYAFGIGGAALAAVGATLIVVSVVTHRRPTALSLSPMVLAGGGGAALGGSF